MIATKIKLAKFKKIADMLHVKTLILNYQCLQELLETGQNVEKLEAYKIQVQKDIDTVLKMYTKTSVLRAMLKRLEKLCCMLEFLHQNKKMIFKIKYKYLENLIHELKCLATLEVDSITKDVLSNALSTKSYKKKLGSLWLPTETESSDSDLISLKRCATNVELKSSHYFKTINHLKKKSEMTYYQYVPISQQKPMGKEAIETTRKHKLLLKPWQKIKLNKINGVYRQIYNNCIDYYNNNKDLEFKENNEVGEKHPLTIWKYRLLNTLRPQLAGSTTRTYYKGIHSTFKRKAVEEFVHNLIECQKRTGMNILKYKTKKNTSCIAIDGRDTRKKKLFSGEFTLGVLKDSKGRKISSNREIKVIRNRLGDYYVHTLKTVVPLQKREPSDCSRVTALDPGCRKFAVSYNCDKSIIYGENTLQKLKKLCKTLDTTISNISKETNTIRRKSMRKACIRIRTRIRNLRNDFHKKVANHLTTNYDVILLPIFRSQSMLPKLNSKSARLMCNWAHFQFRMYLQHKCNVTGCKLYVVREDYTSKTCGNCGYIRTDKYTSENYKCSVCNVDCDRDIMAARNIYIKNLL